jgi:photosystem II stability/assembly factor-like uncharacterized protein
LTAKPWRQRLQGINELNFRLSLGYLIMIGVSVLVSRHANADNFADPIDTPAVLVAAPTDQPLIALSQVGDHFVAVGSRGLSVVSDAASSQWNQAKTPVESDLDAVQFIDAQTGWASGHDGVILHSTDGGRTWTKQLDGIQARALFKAYYTKQASAGNKSAAAMLTQIQLNFEPGPTLPWLSIWFTDAKTGFAVGSFGDIARTDDGGQDWAPWLEHVQNPEFLDLNAIKNIGGTLFMVGEQGTVYVFDPTSQMFVARPTNYTGSLFGMTGTSKSLIVFGMRGMIFRSTDQGKTWNQSTDPSSSSIMAGTALPDGRILLVNVDGGVLISQDDGKSFAAFRNEDMPLTDIVQSGAHQLIVSGLAGVRHVQD